METLNISNPITSPYSQFPPSIFFFRFPPFTRKNEKFNFRSRTKSVTILKPARFSVTGASSSCESVFYGGWDDDLIGSGESTQLRDFFVSTGIGDRRDLFVFLLGIICAFYISRVRVSTIIVFPASALIFAVGFSFGFFRGGSFSGLNLNSSKRKGKDENFRVDIDKLRGLVDFFDGFDVKANNLKNDIQRAIDSEEIELVDLEANVKPLKQKCR